MGVPSVGAVGRLAADPFKHEGYDIRQPQYITVAGQIGIGTFDYKCVRPVNHIFKAVCGCEMMFGAPS
jgi:hypothetical protein